MHGGRVGRRPRRCLAARDAALGLGQRLVLRSREPRAAEVAGRQETVGRVLGHPARDDGVQLRRNAGHVGRGRGRLLVHVCEQRRHVAGLVERDAAGQQMEEDAAE